MMGENTRDGICTASGSHDLLVSAPFFLFSEPWLVEPTKLIRRLGADTVI